MLELDIDVIKGVMFVNLEGELSNITIEEVINELNYLLYKQGMHFFVFNFKDVNVVEYSALGKLQNKLVEIFLSCGNVCMCGIDDICKKKLGGREKLFYVNNEVEALKLLSV